MTRIMNFTAKPVRKQLRNRPKEKQKRANPQGNERIIPDQFSFLYCDLGGGMYFCRTADADLCQCERNCSYCFRCALSPDRGGFLLRNRLSVFAVWLLSCSQETGHVRHPDCDISRNTCSSGVYPVGIYRRNRYLDSDPDRMGVCRYYRPRLYEISRKIVTSGNSIQIQKQKSAVPVKQTTWLHSFLSYIVILISLFSILKTFIDSCKILLKFL